MATGVEVLPKWKVAERFEADPDYVLMVCVTDRRRLWAVGVLDPRCPAFVDGEAWAEDLEVLGPVMVVLEPVVPSEWRVKVGELIEGAR